MEDGKKIFIFLKRGLTTYLEGKKKIEKEAIGQRGKMKKSH